MDEKPPVFRRLKPLPKPPDSSPATDVRPRVPELWEKQLSRTKDGSAFAKTLKNVVLVLTHAAEWRGVIAFDDFAHRLVATREGPAGKAGPWTDEHDLLTTVWLQGPRWRLDVGVDLVAQAVRTVSAAQRVHPLRERLSALRWDGVSRIDTWLTTYLGAEDSAVHRAIGMKWLIGAVARAYEPGCQMDAALILEGEQGRGKSTALKTLAMGFFSDELADIGNKDAAMQLHGAWIVELAELDAISRAEASRVKSFLTRRVDRFRPPWGRHVIEVPRQCVFAGSTNQSDYLRDETGGRRFWSVAIRDIDTDALRRDVEQIWAEAVGRYRTGELSYIADEGLSALLREHTDQRYQVDAWESKIATWLQVRDVTSVGECLEHVGVEPARWTQPDQNRVAKVLKRLGFERKQVRVGAARVWRYERPTHRSVLASLGASGDAVGPVKTAPVPTVSSLSSSSNKEEEERAIGETIRDAQTPVRSGAAVTDENDAPADWWADD